MSVHHQTIVSLSFVTSGACRHPDPQKIESTNTNSFSKPPSHLATRTQPCHLPQSPSHKTSHIPLASLQASGFCFWTLLTGRIASIEIIPMPRRGPSFHQPKSWLPQHIGGRCVSCFTNTSTPSCPNSPVFHIAGNSKRATRQHFIELWNRSCRVHIAETNIHGAIDQDSCIVFVKYFFFAVYDRKLSLSSLSCFITT